MTVLSPLVGQPITRNDFALPHTYGANCSIALSDYKGFDNYVIRLYNDVQIVYVKGSSRIFHSAA